MARLFKSKHHFNVTTAGQSPDPANGFQLRIDQQPPLDTGASELATTAAAPPISALALPVFQLTQSDLDGLRAIVGGQQGDNEFVVGVRTLSGEGNNFAQTGYGAADTPFIRLTDARYGDYNSATGNRDLNPIFAGLDPRGISNTLGRQEADLPVNANGGNIFFMAFGQYFDHGLDFVLKGGNGSIAIGGAGYSPDPALDNPADLTRGTVVAGTAEGTPQHINKTSAFVDQNQAYGSNELVGQLLRESDGAGGVGSHLVQG
ncbi:MAG: peroxidase family protein, partial [Hyphomicrobium sp.]